MGRKAIHYLQIGSHRNRVIWYVLKWQHVCIADLHADRPGCLKLIFHQLSLSLYFQVLPEKRAKSSRVWGGAAKPDHEKGLGGGQPLLEIEVVFEHKVSRPPKTRKKLVLPHTQLWQSEA